MIRSKYPFCGSDHKSLSRHRQQRQPSPADKSRDHAEKIVAFAPAPFLRKTVNQHRNLADDSQIPWQPQRHKEEHRDQPIPEQDTETAGTNRHRFSPDAQTALRTPVTRNAFRPLHPPSHPFPSPLMTAAIGHIAVAIRPITIKMMAIAFRHIFMKMMAIAIRAIHR